MACPSCGGKTHIVREYLDDGSSYAYGVCNTCGWDDAEEQEAALREQISEIDARINALDFNEYNPHGEDYELDEDC